MSSADKRSIITVRRYSTQAQSATMAQPPVTDRLTLIAVSSLTYIAALGLHELLGHGGACLALGNRLTEINAFYVNCDYPRMNDLGIRLFFLAGPVVSSIAGVVGLLVLHRLPPQAFTTKYFCLVARKRRLNVYSRLSDIFRHHRSR